MEPRSLVIEPVSGRFDRADLRWLDEVTALCEDVRAAAPMTRNQSRAVPGTKGFINEIVIPLISAGALTGAIEAARVWLSRDDGRCLRMKLESDGSISEFELTGASLTDEAYESILGAMLGSLGGH